MNAAMMGAGGLPEFTHAASAGLSGVVSELDPEQVSLRLLQQLTQVLLALLRMNRNLWETAKGALERGGADARDLAAHCRFLLREAEENAKTFGWLKLAEEKRFPGHEGFPDLREAAQEIEAMEVSRPTIVSILEFANRAMSLPDSEAGRAALAEALNAPERGRTKAADLIARLQTPRKPA
jgi:hypothetical protein